VHQEVEGKGRKSFSQRKKKKINQSRKLQDISLKRGVLGKAIQSAGKKLNDELPL